MNAIISNGDYTATVQLPVDQKELAGLSRIWARITQVLTTSNTMRNPTKVSRSRSTAVVK